MNKPILNIRQAVVFAILMQNNEGILSKSPDYLLEKLRTCGGYCVPEFILDSGNQAIFYEYAKKYGFNWQKKDAWDVPMDSFDSVTGEPKV